MPRPETHDKAANDKSEAKAKPQSPQEMTRTEIREIEKLQRRDREVKAHELAHKATAGQYARGAAGFDYETGPDGKRYAVGGEVSIDISREADPQETLKKAQIIRRAALAPAEPSVQDRRIAAQAAMMEAEARQELLAERNKSAEPSSDTNQFKTTTTGQRALNAIHAVQSASLEVRENPFDHFI